MRRIASALNEEGIVAPGGNTWDITAIRYILLNEAYRGWRIWNKTKKIRKPDGKKTYRPRKERLMKKKGGDRTAFSTYLLTGLITCAECGGNFIANKQVGNNPNKTYVYYRCNYHSRRGNSVCSNKTGLRGDQLEGAVLDLLQREILTKQNVEALIKAFQKAWKTQEQDDPNKDLKRVERDLKKVGRELANLVQAIRTTGISETLRDELKRCEQRKATLELTKLELQQRQPQALSLPSTQKIAAALGNLSEVLESGNPRDRKTVLEENIEEILVRPTGEALLKANPAGLLPLPDFPLGWCRRRVSDSGYVGDGGPATSTQLENPRHLAVDSSGNIYVTSGHSFHRIRRIDGKTGVISTFAGTGGCGYRDTCFKGDGGDEALAFFVENLALFKVACRQGEMAEVVEHDMAFHRHIVEYGGGADLVAVWVPVVTHMMLPYSRHRDLMDSYREHEAVVEALGRGDKAAALKCLRANIQ